MLIYNIQMGGDPQREGPRGKMINVPIKIETSEDSQRNIGGSKTNKTGLSENTEVSFIYQ